MSDKEPSGPYVYQPFGSVTHPELGKQGRLFGVGGVYPAVIEKLTKAEAEAIVEALRKAGGEAIVEALRDIEP